MARTRMQKTKIGGSEWELNPPVTGNLPPAGFEDHLVCFDAL
jgi:hypothetical protein